MPMVNFTVNSGARCIMWIQEPHVYIWVELVYLGTLFSEVHGLCVFNNEMNCQNKVFLSFQSGTSKVDCQSDCPTECIHYDYDYQVQVMKNLCCFNHNQSNVD